MHRGGVFCALHELEYGVKCHVCGCTNQKVDDTQACIEHQAQWRRFQNAHKSQKLSGFQRMLQQPGEIMSWEPVIHQNPQPHDEAMPEAQNSNYFTPNRFYCVETICAPYGVVIAWAKFARAESPTNILQFLASVYPTEESQPDYICIDKACLVLRTSISNGSWEEWKKKLVSSLLIHITIPTIRLVTIFAESGVILHHKMDQHLTLLLLTMTKMEIHISQ